MTCVFLALSLVIQAGAIGASEHPKEVHVTMGSVDMETVVIYPQIVKERFCQMKMA